MLEHTLSTRVYYADTDAQAVVYHANYLKFFESARTESLRSLGIELPFLLSEYGVGFAVVDMRIKFHKPARLDDKLCIVSRISKLGRASVVYLQTIYLSDKSGPLLCEAEVKLVTIDRDMRPVAVPTIIEDKIK